VYAKPGSSRTQLQGPIGRSVQPSNARPQRARLVATLATSTNAGELAAWLNDGRNAKGDLQVQHLLDHRAVLQREPLVAVTILHDVVQRLNKVSSGVKPYWRKSLLVSWLWRRRVLDGLASGVLSAPCRVRLPRRKVLNDPRWPDDAGSRRRWPWTQCCPRCSKLHPACFLNSSRSCYRR
jgi:hypothetical protein